MPILETSPEDREKTNRMARAKNKTVYEIIQIPAFTVEHRYSEGNPRIKMAINSPDHVVVGVSPDGRERLLIRR